MKIYLKSVITLFVLVLFVNLSAKAQKNSKKEYVATLVGFYNLENLFDTINTPDVKDEEFTPEGPKLWNGSRYYHKLHNMAKVIAQIGTEINPDGLAVLGISEVENESVVKDLIAQPVLKNRNYKIIHYNSPDRRGIDVAMLYNPKYFKPYKTSSHRLHVEKLKDFKTRDQLLVDGVLSGDTVHIIVNHWPSRYGGEKRSRWLRNAAAQLSRSIADSILQQNPHARIMVMGDLNDNPNNESVLKFMNAKGKRDKLKDNDFFNPMWEMYKKGNGTLAWHDTWSLFDQIMISQALLGKDYNHIKYLKAVIYKKPFLVNKDGRYKGYPYRTFVGNTFQGGYSDHLPVFVVLVKEAR
jgi:hypothetical protein